MNKMSILKNLPTRVAFFVERSSVEQTVELEDREAMKAYGLPAPSRTEYRAAVRREAERRLVVRRAEDREVLDILARRRNRTPYAGWPGDGGHPRVDDKTIPSGRLHPGERP